MTLKEQLLKGTLVLDGGMGTQLALRGAKGNNELWGMEHPEALSEIHKAYLEAGSQAIISNTFGGNGLKLGKVGLEPRVEELNRGLVQIAGKAAGTRAWVLGDVGPTGQFVEPYGDFTEEEMTDVFRRQIMALLEGGADGIIIETMMDVVEASCAVRAAKGCGSSVPVLATMTFDVNPKGFRTLMGVPPADTAARLADAGVDAVGANCGGLLPSQYHLLIAEMRAATALPLIAEPNAGLPELEDGETVFKETPQAFGEAIPGILAAGATVLGGCCGTTPDHIRALVKTLEQTNR